MTEGSKDLRGFSGRSDFVMVTGVALGTRSTNVTLELLVIVVQALTLGSATTRRRDSVDVMKMC